MHSKGFWTPYFWPYETKKSIKFANIEFWNLYVWIRSYLKERNKNPPLRTSFFNQRSKGGSYFTPQKFEKLKITEVVKLWRRSKYTISRTLLRLLTHEKHFFIKFFDSQKNEFFEKSWFTSFCEKSKGGFLFRSLR